MNEITATMAGNVTKIPEPSFTQSGTAKCVLTIAVTERRMVRGEWQDTNTSFPRLVVWGQMAENVANCIRVGDRVIVTAHATQRQYENDGEQRYIWEWNVTEIGLSLKFHGASSLRMRRSKSTETRTDNANDATSPGADTNDSAA